MSNVVPLRSKSLKNITDNVVEGIVNNLSYNGLEIGPEDVKDLALIIESVRSLVHKKQNMEHPMQHLSKTLFTDQEGSEHIQVHFHQEKVYSL